MTLSVLWRVWHFLTRPHPIFTEIDDIRRSRMTMVFSLAMAVVCFMGSIAAFASRGQLHVAVIILWTVTAICMAGYFLGRSRHYRIGALIITWIFSLCGYLTAIFRPDDMSGALFSFVPVSLVLAGGLLPFWQQVFLTAFNVAVTMAFPRFMPVATDMARNAGIFTALGIIIIIISGFRDILDTSRLLGERQKSEERLNSQLELQKLAAEISTKFINIAADEMDRTIQETLQRIGELTNLDRSYVFLYFDNLTRVDCVFEWCAEGIEPEIQNLKGLKLNRNSWWTSRILRGEVIALSSFENMPSGTETLVAGLKEQGIQSILAVPIAHRTQVMGYIGFDAVREKKAWHESHVALLKMIGDVFANALERRRTEKEAVDLRKNIEAQSWIATGQAQLADVMRGEQTISQLAENVLSYLCRYTDTQAGALFLLEGKTLTLAGAYAYFARPDFNGVIALGEGLVGQAAANGKVLYQSVPSDALILSTGLVDMLPRQIAAAPFYMNEKVVGVLELATLSEFTENHLELWNRISETLGNAFHVVQTRQRLAELLTASQQQAEELQAQEEELRAANEELHAQAESKLFQGRRM
jgi:GAF domain-containing protein